jgi:hypothetical protein
VNAKGHVFFAPVFPTNLGTVGVAGTQDEGASWKVLLPSLAGQPDHQFSDDSYFYLDPRTGRMFLDDLQGLSCSEISFSDDEGATWTTSLSGCLTFDHQTIFAGKPARSTTMGYPDVVYYCAYAFGATTATGTGSACLKSLDGGMTWLPTGMPINSPTLGPGLGGDPYCNGALGHGAVGPDGTVYVPHGFCSKPQLAISHDEGATWTNVVVSDLGMATSDDGYVDHEGGIGVDAQGNLYYTWEALDRLPHLAVSRDGGATWSPPLEIGAPGLTQASRGEVIVGGVGKLAFVYLGSANAPGAPFPAPPDCDLQPQACLTGPDRSAYANATWNGYLTISTDALGAQPTFLTAMLTNDSDPLMRGYCAMVGDGCGPLFDFFDVRLGPDGTPWASLVDGCLRQCASGSSAKADGDEGVVGRLWGGPSLLDPNGTQGSTFGVFGAPSPVPSWLPSRP